MDRPRPRLFEVPHTPIGSWCAVVHSPVACWHETRSASENSAGEAAAAAIKRAVEMRMGPLLYDRPETEIWKDMRAEGWRLETWMEEGQ